MIKCQINLELLCANLKLLHGRMKVVIDIVVFALHVISRTNFIFVCICNTYNVMKRKQYFKKYYYNRPSVNTFVFLTNQGI
jgi:IS4 transposase